MTMLCTRCLRAIVARQQLRRFSTNSPLLSSAPVLSTPITKPGEALPPKGPRTARSICIAGTVLTGLNFTKGGKDPVAMKDEEYPQWLWSCLDVIKTKSEKGDNNDADEFSKSKKTRREAAKRARALEAAGGSSAPKIPVQRQSINLPGAEGGSFEDNINAIHKRDELRRAMRMERKAKIKESNFLKSM